MTNWVEQDELLVIRAKEGDKEAFGDLYELYVDEIYHFSYYRVSNREDAEDIVEAVFIRAWQALAKHPPRKITFRLWLYRITHNAIVDHYRTRKQAVLLDEGTGLIAPIPTPEMQVNNEEQSLLLHNAIQALKPDHQQVLTCRFFAGLSHKETAQIMNRDEQAVRALQYRAINSLRKLFVSQEGCHV